jgi:hypothetical protein
MPLPIIGTDCDITLTHPSVNGGAPYGFILAADPSVRGGAISIQRSVDTLTGVISIRLVMTVLMADDLKNPNGSVHGVTRAVMYDKMIAYLATTDGLAIDTVMGTWLGLAPLGFSVTEMHQVKVSHIACQFDNISLYHPPISYNLVASSLWDGPTLTWASSYWR